MLIDFVEVERHGRESSGRVGAAAMRRANFLEGETGGIYRARRWQIHKTQCAGRYCVKRNAHLAIVVSRLEITASATLVIPNSLPSFRLRGRRGLHLQLYTKSFEQPL